MDELIEILHKEKCSCVIRTLQGKVVTCHNRGVRDLYEILKKNRDMLNGASVADKVVGKGAAALMMLGGVAEVYTDVISRSALSLFKTGNIKVGWGSCVPEIINRAGTGRCPVELLCDTFTTPEQCLPAIESFIASLK